MIVALALALAIDRDAFAREPEPHAAAIGRVRLACDHALQFEPMQDPGMKRRRGGQEE